jgi:addiction module RelE/StbE family toxin
MKVVWRPMADADREQIFDYIAQDNPRAALELDEEFKTKAALAAREPGMYRKSERIPGTREIVVRRNYIMIYRVIETTDTLAVLRVMHSARQWPPGK